MEIATAFVTIRPQTDGFEAELASAVGGVPDQEVTLTADAEVEQAQAEIDGVDGGSTEIKVEADTAQAQASVDDLSGAIGGLADQAGLGGGALGGLTEGLAGLAGGSTAATAGVGALVGGLVLSVNAAGEAEAVNAKLAQVLETTGAGAFVTQGAINDLASEIMGYSGQSDEAINSAATLLLTFQGLSNEASINAGILDRATRSTADIAALMGGDASGAALRLGRALDDPARGMSMLQRSGVSFTQSQKDAIVALAESGDMLGAQSALLDVVESQVGGVAAAYGGTLPGSLDKATEAAGELAEAVGGDLVPAVTSATEDITSYIEALQSAREGVSGWADGLVGEIQGIGLESALESAPIIGPIIGTIDTFRDAMGAANTDLEGVGRVVGTLPPGLRETGAAAEEAAGGIEALAQSTDAYVNGLFSVPGAQREARQSFAELTTAMAEGTWDDQAVAMENVVISTANLIARQREQGATTAELDRTIFGSIATLAQMRDAGQITGAQFDRLSAQIRDVPRQATTEVTTPGIEGALSNLRSVKTTIDGIPRDIVVRVSVPNLGAIAADVAGAAASLRSLRDVESIGAGIGRTALASVAPAPLPPVQVVIDRQVVAEASFEGNRRLAMAEGYEP